MQSSKGYTNIDGKLTLKGVSQSTVVFADRPERMAVQTVRCSRTY